MKYGQQTECAELREMISELQYEFCALTLFHRFLKKSFESVASDRDLRKIIRLMREQADIFIGMARFLGDVGGETEVLKRAEKTALVIHAVEVCERAAEARGIRLSPWMLRQEGNNFVETNNADWRRADRDLELYLQTRQPMPKTPDSEDEVSGTRAFGVRLDGDWAN